jgi:hypothetical protein
MLLSVNLKDKDASPDLFLESLFNIGEDSSDGLGRLDFDRGSLLEKSCKELIKVLQSSPTGNPDSRLHKFLNSLLQQKTNLGIETREIMVALEAWRRLRSATTWESIIPLMEKIADAFDIVGKGNIKQFNQAFKDPFCRDQQCEETENNEDIPPDIYMARYLISAKIVLDGVWYWLFDIKDIPREIHYSEKLEKKVDKAIEKLNQYVKNDNKLKDPQMEEFRAVILRDLSLLEASKKEKPYSFVNEIGNLEKAYNLLNPLINSNKSKTGVLIKTGINQSIIALLRLKEASSQGKAVQSAREVFNEVIKLYDDNKRDWQEYPFLLLTEARLSSRTNIYSNLKKLAKDAKDLYYQIGWDYFSKLIDEMNKEF